MMANRKRLAISVTLAAIGMVYIYTNPINVDLSQPPSGVSKIALKTVGYDHDKQVARQSKIDRLGQQLRQEYDEKYAEDEDEYEDWDSVAFGEPTTPLE